MKQVDTIICDVSGTHTRVAYILDEKILGIRDYETKDINSIKNLISIYMYLEKVESKKISCSAAGTIKSNSVHLGRIDLTITKKELEELGFEKIQLINDFEAVALGVYDVKKYEELGSLIYKKDYLTVGAGTGFGISICSKNNLENLHNKKIPITILDKRLNPREEDCKQYFEKEFGKDFDIEEIISGSGLEKIYTYIAGSKLTAEEISKFDTVSSQETFDLFYSFYFKTMIYFLEKYSVTTIYIAGGIIMKNMDKFSKQSKTIWKDFFQEKNIAAKIILDYDISLYGLRKKSLES